MSRSLKYYRHIPNLLYRMNRMTLTGIFQRPPGYEVLRRVPPSAPPLHSRHPGAIVFDEDYLYNKLFARLPELKDEGSELFNEKQSLTTLFIRLWHQNIQSGLGEEEAYQRTFTALKPKIQDYRDKIIFDPDRSHLATRISASNIHTLIKSRMVQLQKLGKSMAEEQAQREKKPSILDQIEERINSRGQRGGKALEVNLKPSEGRKTMLELQAEHEDQYPELYTLFDSDVALDALVRYMDYDPYLQYEGSEEERQVALRQYQYWIIQQTWFDTMRLQRYKAQLLYHSSFDQLIIHPEAQYRDFVAYILRYQTKILRQSQLIPIPPYTDPINSQLFRVARIIYQSERIENLVEMLVPDLGYTPMSFPFEPDRVHDDSPEFLQEKYGLVNGKEYGVMDQSERDVPLTGDDINKHKLVMHYIDLAIDDYEEFPNMQTTVMDRLWLQKFPRDGRILVNGPAALWVHKAHKERQDLIKEEAAAPSIKLQLSQAVDGSIPVAELPSIMMGSNAESAEKQ